MRLFLTLILVVAVNVRFAVAQADLPPKVQADLLYNEIRDTVAAGNLTLALEKIDQYKTLGVSVPPALIYLEARAAIALNDPLRGKRTLDAYFKNGGEKDENYADALKVYQSVAPAAEQEIERLAAEKCAASEVNLADTCKTEQKAQLVAEQVALAEKVIPYVGPIFRSVAGDWLFKYACQQGGMFPPAVPATIVQQKDGSLSGKYAEIDQIKSGQIDGDNVVIEFGKTTKTFLAGTLYTEGTHVGVLDEDGSRIRGTTRTRNGVTCGMEAVRADIAEAEKSEKSGRRRR